MEVLSKNRNLLIFEGIVFLLLGILAVALPGISTLSMELFIGWLLLIGGVVQAYRSIKARHADGFVGSLLMSLIYIVFGLLLLVYPLAGIISLTLLLTFFFIVDGISKIILGIQMRSSSSWGWFIFSGIISLAMAYIIFAGWPGTAFWVLGLLVGINMIFFGLSLLTFTAAIPKTTPEEPNKNPVDEPQEKK
jgi:uncharacterized membrane protein HdeD (DUF308 family)